MNQFPALIVFSLVAVVVEVCGQYDAFYREVAMPDVEDDPELDPADVEEAGCPKIEHLKNVNLREILGTWHGAYMSKHWIRYMAKTMHGKFMKKSYMGRTCIKINVKELPNGTPNNTEATIWLQSKCPRTGAEWSLACAPNDDLNSKWWCNDKFGKTHDGDSFVYVVDTDGKTWALVVRCFPNNGMNWAILSKVKELDSALVKSLLAEVEYMGFKLFNVVEVPYEKCVSKP